MIESVSKLDNLGLPAETRLLICSEETSQKRKQSAYKDLTTKNLGDKNNTARAEKNTAEIPQSSTEQVSSQNDSCGDGICVDVNPLDDEYRDDEDGNQTSKSSSDSESTHSSDEQSSHDDSYYFSDQDDEDAHSFQVRPEHLTPRLKVQRPKTRHSPVNNSDEDSDIDLEEMKKDPKVRKFLKLMLNHEPVRQEKGKSKGKTPSPVTSHQKGVTSNLINNAVSRVKSPSDTTIYAPVPNKQQNADARNMDTINQISSFVERLRVQSEGNGSPGTSTGRRTEQGQR